jgi:hypothetical protein
MSHVCVPPSLTVTEPVGVPLPAPTLTSTVMGSPSANVEVTPVMMVVVAIKSSGRDGDGPD